MLGRESKSSTVLVAHDGSQASRAAAHVAVQIAKRLNLAIQGLYVVDEPLIMETYADAHKELGISEGSLSRSQLIAAFEAQGEAAVQWLESLCQEEGVPVHVDMIVGGVPQIIRLKAAESLFLAMGRRGHGHPDDARHLGSKYKAVAHHTDRPILAGGGRKTSGTNNLLLGYNGRGYAQDALALAVQLHCKLPATLTVIYVQESVTQSPPVLTDMQRELERQCSDGYHFIRREGKPGTEIVKAAIEREADLIVVGRYRHSSAVEWVVGSTLDHILRNSHLPILFT